MSNRSVRQIRAIKKELLHNVEEHHPLPFGRIDRTDVLRCGCGRELFFLKNKGFWCNACRRIVNVPEVLLVIKR